MRIAKRVSQWLDFGGKPSKSQRRAGRKQNRIGRALSLESLEDRKVMAATLAFTAPAELTITADPAGSQVYIYDLDPSNTPSNPNDIFHIVTVSNDGTRAAAYHKSQITKFKFIGSNYADVYQAPTGIGWNWQAVTHSVDARGGGDVITTGMFGDFVNAGSGDNTVSVGGGVDTVYGGSDDDTLDGGSGGDYLYGYGGENTLRGGSGDDRLFGGSQNDTLEGGAGVDRLYGYSGDDTLDGGDGDDFLYGDGDNDLLRGGAGNDRLYGYGGDDTLYGGPGNDTLHGDSGNDGLFGGGGVDNLYGGADADRLLVWDALLTDLAYHTVHSVESQDAVIRFKDTWAQNKATTSGVSGEMKWSGEIWAEEEIEAVDRSLAWLHDLTDNTRMLKTSTGAALSFERWGAYESTSISFGAGVFAWNLGSGAMAITDYGFANGDEELDLTVIHEVAHNWDSESSVWSQWKAESGWVVASGSPAWNQRQSGDGDWFYNSSAQFYNTNARRNPYEDWAWTFEAYYKQQKGTLASTTASRLADKFDLIDQFVTSITT